MKSRVDRASPLGAAACIATLLMLAACGGGADAESPPGGSPPPSSSPPPGSTAAAPAIATQPADLAVAEGDTATFTVVADGSAPLSYQWRRDGVDIAGATAASYSLAATSADDGAGFDVRVSNPTGAVTSATAHLAVTPSTPAGPPAPGDDSIALHRQGDIYLAKIDGSDLRAVTSGAGDERFAAVTPDGHLIYTYSTGTGNPIELRSVWLDGTHDTLLASGTLVFAALLPGNRVAFHEYSGAGTALTTDLAIVNADGTGRLTLAASAERDEYQGAHATGDTGRVVYRRYPPTGGGMDLRSVEFDGDGDVALADTPDFENLLGIDDSGRVYFRRQGAGGNALVSIDIAGGAEVVISPQAVFGGLIGAGAASRVLFRESGTLISSAGDGTDRLTLAGAPPSGWTDEGFHLLPDGRVVFGRGPLVAPVLVRDLHVAAADGSSLVQLTDTPDRLERYAGFAGERVIYTSMVSGADAQIDLYSVLPDGSDPRVLSEAPEDEDFAAVTPDGRVVFSREVPLTGGSQDLYSIAADGSDLIALSATADDEQFLGLATPPSGAARVIFLRDPGSGSGSTVYSVNSDGSDLVELATDVQVFSYSGVF